MNNLATTLWQEGRYNEAEKLELHVLEYRKKLFGAEHPNTIIIMNNLARTWKEQGRDAEAIKLMEHCVQLSTKAFGAAHPKTVSVAEILKDWKKKRRRFWKR
jgi:Flp pilus assembly protein TadD